MGGRKIIHIDMDAFYASVEQRDRPELRGKPVVVAWRGNRSVVCAASYEARRFGVRSAMPARRAERLCPNAVFLPPDFARYKAVSRQVREILLRHSDRIEFLSLDEAYLDVSGEELPQGGHDMSYPCDHTDSQKGPDGTLATAGEPCPGTYNSGARKATPAPAGRRFSCGNKTGLPTATLVARTIRQQIRTELNLKASAGVAPNKFLAKIASDWRKPDGLFVIQPEEVEAFLTPLEVGRIPGVGKVMEAKLKALEVATVGDLRKLELSALEGRFGRYGVRLYELARGIDRGEVIANRPTQSISSEDTLERDVLLGETEAMIRKLAEHTWKASRKEARIARTVVLKLKTSEFKILTRSHTPASPPGSCEELTRIALALRGRVQLKKEQRFRLVGVGLANFREREDQGGQAGLFGGDADAAEEGI